MAPIIVPILPAAPNIDGKVAGETNWAGSLQVYMGTTNRTYLRIGSYTDTAGQQYVFLGVHTPELQPSMNCRLVVGLQTLFNPPPGPTCAWKIHVYPFGQSQPPGTSLTPSRVEYWRNPPGQQVPGATDWNHTAPSSVLPGALNPNNSWLWDYTRTWYYANTIWAMEMRIPVNPAGNYGDGGVWFPPAGGANWSLYVNLLNSPNAGGPGNVQRPWPAAPLPMGDINIATPDQGAWGLASL